MNALVYFVFGVNFVSHFLVALFVTLAIMRFTTAFLVGACASGALASTSTSASCQDQLNSYCNTPSNCLAHVTKFKGPLTALHDGPGNPEWRCYADSALDANKTHYVSGSDYCTRDDPLAAINATCSGDNTFVFEAGMGGIACFRIPAVVQTADASTILAFAEARYGSCSDGATHALATRKSSDGGKTWSDLGFAVGNSSYMVGNPTAVALANGSVALVYVKHTPR